MTTFFICALMMAFNAVFLVAAISKCRQAWAARSWVAAPGRIMISQAVSRDVNVMRGTTRTGRIKDKELRNFAFITYDFKTPKGEKSGSRVTIGEDMGNFEVAETLARYPRGKAVTVYYDPADPSQCVLERDISERFCRGCLAASAIIGALIIAGYLGADWMFAQAERLLPNRTRSSLTFMLFAMGAFAALIGLAIRKQCALARKWPIAPGHIVQSGLVLREAWWERDDTAPGSFRWDAWRSRVVYSYAVGGNNYTGDKISFGMDIFSPARWAVGWQVAWYAPGATVNVRYNPENPAEAVLEPKAPGVILVWLFSAALLFAAARVGGFF